MRTGKNNFFCTILVACLSAVILVSLLGCEGGDDPIDVTGRWTGIVTLNLSNGENGSLVWGAELTQSGNHISGWGGSDGQVVYEGTITGSHVVFSGEGGAGPMYAQITYTGTVAGNTMIGSVSGVAIQARQSVTISGTFDLERR